MKFVMHVDSHTRILDNDDL